MNKELLKRGTEVFNSKDKFLNWYNRQNYSLGGEKPSEVEEKEVYSILGRIECGIFS